MLSDYRPAARSVREVCQITGRQCLLSCLVLLSNFVLGFVGFIVLGSLLCRFASGCGFLCSVYGRRLLWCCAINIAVIAVISASRSACCAFCLEITASNAFCCLAIIRAEFSSCLLSFAADGTRSITMLDFSWLRCQDQQRLHEYGYSATPRVVLRAYFVASALLRYFTLPRPSRLIQRLLMICSAPLSVPNPCLLDPRRAGNAATSDNRYYVNY